MPHFRERYLSELLTKALKFSPAVGVLGQRQSGKTTLVAKIAKEYRSLDDRKELEIALKEPETFLKTKSYPFAIDECQLAPPLFPAIKENIRVYPGQGHFILTGSVRFTSRKAIRESLTGRIFNLELLPLSPKECSQLPLSELPHHLLKNTDTAVQRYLEKQSSQKFDFKIDGFLTTGGLPGICFHRDEFIRNGKFLSHLETILERDLRLLIQTKLSYFSLSELLSVLARRQGLPLDLSEISRVSRISRPTLRQLLQAFESLFLIRILPAQGGTKRPVLLFEDQGLGSYLARSPLDPYTDLYRVLFASVFPQYHYRPELNARVFHFLTRGGARVPLAFQAKDGVVGYIPEPDSKVTVASLSSARSFLKQFSKSKVMIAHAGTEVRQLDHGIYSLPLRLCL